MKKIFLLALPIILLTGCSVSVNEPVDPALSGMKEQISLLQEQISGLQQEVLTLKINSLTPDKTGNIIEETENQFTGVQDRYRKIYSKNYSLSKVSSDASFA